MKIILAAILIILMMPISYAMLDEAVRKIRIKRPGSQESK
jgi:hypothetical protein